VSDCDTGVAEGDGTLPEQSFHLQDNLWQLGYAPAHCVEDQDHIIRHYTLRGVPAKNYSISVYTDESRISRFRDGGLADASSRPID